MPALPPDLAVLLRSGESARPIPGYSRYWVTDQGRAISAVRAPRVLQPFPHPKGYLQVELWPSPPNGEEHPVDPSSLEALAPSTASRSTVRPRRAYVHEIVLLAFVGPRPTSNDDQYDIYHLNGLKRDNRMENLRYLPRSENVRRSERGRTGRTKLDVDAVRALRRNAAAYGAEVAAAKAVVEYGVTMRSAHAAIAGRTWRWLLQPCSHIA